MKPSSPADQRLLIMIFYCGPWEHLVNWCYGVRKDLSLRWEIPKNPTGWRWVLDRLGTKFSQRDFIWREKHVMRRVRPHKRWRRKTDDSPEA